MKMYTIVPYNVYIRFKARINSLSVCVLLLVRRSAKIIAFFCFFVKDICDLVYYDMTGKITVNNNNNDDDSSIRKKRQ